MDENRNISILGMLSDIIWCERLDKIMLGSEEYRKAQKRIDDAVAEYKRQCGSDEEWETVDRLVTAYSASGALHAGAAYQQGMKDCVSLLKEIGII